MKRKEHVLDLMQDLHVPKYLRGDDAYQQQKRKRKTKRKKPTGNQKKTNQG